MTARLPTDALDARFPRVAALLRQGEVRLASPDDEPPAPSPNLARALDDALRREGIEDFSLAQRLADAVRSTLGIGSPAPEAPADVPLLRHGGRGARAERARSGALEEDDDE